MDNKVALFTDQFGRRIKNTVEESEKNSASFHNANQARLLAGHTSPVEITGSWTLDGGAWTCRARRLWRIDGLYQPIDDGIEFDLYHPTSMEQPSQSIGERVFAVFRGVWELVSGAAVGGTAPASEPAAVIEPIRRPLFRNLPPFHCFGTIALPGKSYRPIRALDEEGNPLQDEDGNPLYFKKREPRTGNARFVLRQEGKTSNPIEWIHSDGTEFTPDNWATTTDPEQAQLNYEPAVCYNLDWSELLIEGDKVEYQAHTIEIDGKAFTYYEVQPIQEFTVPVEGQADVALHIVTPIWDNDHQAGDPVSYTIEEVDSQRDDKVTPPDFEAVYLKLEDDHCTPKLVKKIGICNDCTSLRVRGVFIREDIKGRRYPMMFELATLRAGGAIRVRDVTCYYKTEHDSCSPILRQPELKLIRLNEWRLSLSPTVCAVSCTELVDPTSSTTAEEEET